MSENRIPEHLPQPPQLNPPVRFEFFLIFVKVLITVMFMFPLAHYSMFGESVTNETQRENQTEMDNETIHEESIILNKTKVIKMRIILPPSCPMSYIQVILQELCNDYVFEATSCTPEDFENLKKHQIPVNSARKNSVADPRANIVGFLTSILLIASLVAAFLELYKAKQLAPAKNKVPLTRKCSLADLTVMKHHRKEVVRRDSIYDSHKEAKQPDYYKKAPPLQRSSSTPAEPISEISAYFNRSFDSRRNSVLDNQQFNNYKTAETSSGRSNLDSRRCSLLDSKKPLLVDGKSVDRYDINGKRISIIDITSSPERKHHSRLVHRH